MTDTIDTPTTVADSQRYTATVPAGRLALAWKYVARACDQGDWRPALSGVAFHFHDHGVRLAGTDSFVLLHCWVHGTTADPGGATDPGLDVDPTGTAVVVDPNKSARRFVRSVAKADPAAFVQVVAGAGIITFGHDRTGCTVKALPGDQFPDWRRLVRGEGTGNVFRPTPTGTVRLGPEIVARVLARPYSSAGPKLTFSGEEGPIGAEWTDLAVPLRGLIMPRRADR